MNKRTIPLLLTFTSALLLSACGGGSDGEETSFTGTTPTTDVDNTNSNVGDTVNPVDTVETVNPVDTVETANPVDTVETANPVDNVETANPVDTVETVNPVDTVETVNPGDTGDGDTPLIVESNEEKIEAVFLAQTHVLAPDDQYFKLVGNRDALLKVQVIDSSAGAAPSVSVKLNLNLETTTLNLQGPASLPVSFDGALGKVQHQFSDSFTVVIPKKWVQPGLQIQVSAGDESVSHDLKVGAPNAIDMNMFDVHYFGLGDKDYPDGTFAELEAKWPVSSLNVERIKNIDFLEMVIPARGGAGTPHVRITSKDEYLVKTGKNFDGEQAAALQWVHALSASGGNQDTVMSYINIIGVFAGGQAGGFDGVGSVSVGILNHELGHSLSLPHAGQSAAHPYKGDMRGITAPDQLDGTHVGPTWAFDLPTMTFIPPTVQAGAFRGVVGTYKASPMQGGGTGDQESPFLMRHFSDYEVNKMQNYIESKLAVKGANSWYKWDSTSGDYSKEIFNGLDVRYPTQTDVQVISVMAATSVADTDINMVYTPIGPYKSNLIKTFDPSIATDRAEADDIYCPNDGCDFSLRITQGSTTKTYMLAASGIEGIDAFDRNALKTVAINLPASNGAVTNVELLLTPNAEKIGLPSSPEILDTYAQKVSSPGAFAWNDPSVQSCTNVADGPVKVFILAGQSNMVGQGTITPTQAHLDKNSGKGTLTNLATQSEYSYLLTENGDWAKRDDAWIASGNRFGDLTVGWGSNQEHIGPELEFGRRMADLYENQVLIIKTAWGGTSLAKDWRPPSSGNAVGPRYTQMLAEVKDVLSNLETRFPNYQGQGFEIAGIAWHQGWNDRINQSYNDEYQTNMVNFINDVRSEMDNEELPFVLATTGMSGWDETHPRALSLMNAQLATPNDNRLNKTKVAAVEARDFWISVADSPANQNQSFHWNRNAEISLSIGGGLADSINTLICQ